MLLLPGYGGYDPYGYGYGFGMGGAVIGTHTKSRDERSMRSRVFVGNLNPKVLFVSNTSSGLVSVVIYA